MPRSATQALAQLAAGAGAAQLNQSAAQLAAARWLGWKENDGDDDDSNRKAA